MSNSEAHCRHVYLTNLLISHGSASDAVIGGLIFEWFNRERYRNPQYVSRVLHS